MSAAPPDLLDKVQVAHWLGYGSVATFYRKLRQGELPGFPPRVAGTRLWDPDHLRAWRMSQIPPDLRRFLEAPAPAPANDRHGHDPELAARARRLFAAP